MDPPRQATDGPGQRSTLMATQRAQTIGSDVFATKPQNFHDEPCKWGTTPFQYRVFDHDRTKRDDAGVFLGAFRRGNLGHRVCGPFPAGSMSG